MTSIEDKINQARLKQEQGIRKSLGSSIYDIRDEIQKAKAAQPGEIREWGGKKYMKGPNGWRPVGKGKTGVSGEAEGKDQGAEKSQENEGKQEITPEILAESAKKSSEAALMNATKMSTDPKVREAAHKELMRRKNEEAQESFKGDESLHGKDENGKDLSPMAQDGKNKLEQEKKAKAEKEKNGEGGYKSTSAEFLAKKKGHVGKLNEVADKREAEGHPVAGRQGYDPVHPTKKDPTEKSAAEGDDKVKQLNKLLGEYDYRYGERKKMLDHIMQKYPNLDVNDRALNRTLMSNPESPEDFDTEFAEHSAHYKLSAPEQILDRARMYNNNALINAIKEARADGLSEKDIKDKYPEAHNKVRDDVRYKNMFK